MTKEIKIGTVKIGGKNPVAVQSMANTMTCDIKSTAEQINLLAQAGCAVVRVAVKNEEDARAIRLLKRETVLPLVADIHFDHRMALAAIEQGADKIRINPGNIGGAEKMREVARAAAECGIPIRVGINSGSLPRDILKSAGNSAEAIALAAQRYVKTFEDFGFTNLVVSAKSSEVPVMIKAYRLIAADCPYPLHLGVTEAGVGERGIIKSAVGIGSLLADGIGDTIRVSLSGNPVKEIAAANRIIEASGRAEGYIDVVACPTCGRTEIPVEEWARKVEEAVQGLKSRHNKSVLKIAVMGCVVNGPGEAADADIAVCGGREKSAIYFRGKLLKTLPNEAVLSEILALFGGLTNDKA